VHGPPKDSGKAIFYETISSLKKDQQKNKDRKIGREKMRKIESEEFN
jgi:hypothetical protein